jgi:glycosyltransferase XagB
VSQAVGLLRAILLDLCPSDAAAVAELEAILALEIDPLDYCALTRGIGRHEVMVRAARWAGLFYSPHMPRTMAIADAAARIDSFSKVRSLRGTLLDRDLLFVAPDFFELVQLAQRCRDQPDLTRRLCLVPAAAIRAELSETAGNRLLDEARQRLARRWPRTSAHLDLALPLRRLLVAVLAALFALTVLAVLYSLPAVSLLIGVLMVVPAILRVAAVLVPIAPGPGFALLDDSELPVYSVLIPLRDEAHMVPMLVDAMRALDYPPEKLDIKFVVESLSPGTVSACRQAVTDPLFEMVCVPDGAPRTKPKALNFAMPFVRGEHMVIYDAEDIPEPGQLRLAASQFAAAPHLDCLQAELVVENAGENWLTALFAGEYAGQFGLMLPALARWGLPMPLGGTSNHFRTSALREVGGWDAFNVTEDADLGVRLSRLRYRTATLTSRTLEEAPVEFRPWLRQRTRWMKGFMQTFIVHNAHPRLFLADVGWKGFLAFQVYVGSMITSPLLHTAYFLGLAIKATLHGPASLSAFFDPLYFSVLALGYTGAFALTIAGLAKLGRHDLFAYQFVLPFYWGLHSLAAVRAGYELLTRPFFWAKTEHGRTRIDRGVRPVRQNQVSPPRRSARDRATRNGV